MSMVDTLHSLTSKLAGATKTVTDQIGDLRRRITETRQALQRAQMAPVPIDEIVETRIPAYVAEVGDHWLARYGAVLVRGERGLGAPDLRGSARLPWGLSDPMPFAALCAARPDEACALLADLVRRVGYEEGARLAERPALVAQLERELGELESTEIAAVDAACSAGVTIAHRAEIVARREQEARQHELHEQEIAARRRRQDAIDELHRQRSVGGRVGRSQYLDSGGVSKGV